MDTLLRHLPRGQAQYVRDHDDGTWKVCVFKAGTVEVMETVATNMDKSVACWMTNKLNQAFNRLHM
jgi:Leu/Phe-tRNA-protein transferase